MSRKAILFTAIAAALCLVGIITLHHTGQDKGTHTDIPAEQSAINLMRYARNLKMTEYADRTEVSIRNPWDTTQILHRYILSPEKCVSDEGATAVRIPLKRAAVFTSVQCALMTELGCSSAIGGVCEVEYIHVPYVQEGVQSGRILNLGNGMNPNLERLMDLQPDAIMTTPFENSGGYGRLERMGIPIIECADYMERGPLARAEWVRFYGRLMGKAAEADSLFRSVEHEYLRLCRLVREQASSRPALLAEIPQSGHWYVPGGQSTMGQLYQDAGAHYLFSDIPGAGSTPLSIEQVLDRAAGAQAWVFKHHGPVNVEQLRKDYPALRRIEAEMFLCDTSTSLFYEETPYHPDRLLKNLIRILHPELGLSENYSYFCPVER